MPASPAASGAVRLAGGLSGAKTTRVLAAHAASPYLEDGDIDRNDE
jgi:hypothetical protein